MNKTPPNDVVHNFVIGSSNLVNKNIADAKPIIKKRGLNDANESITPDNSGSGSKTNSGSESSGDDAPAMLGARRVGFFNVALRLVIVQSLFLSI